MINLIIKILIAGFVAIVIALHVAENYQPTNFEIFILVWITLVDVNSNKKELKK